MEGGNKGGGTAHGWTRIRPKKTNRTDAEEGCDVPRLGYVEMSFVTDVGTMQGALLQAELVRSIVGGFFDVYNYFGYGLSERVYGGALSQELSARGHSVIRELHVNIRYRGMHAAAQRLDMVIDDKIIVENKATEKISSADRKQILSYLRATKFEVGLLLHFRPIAELSTLYRLPKERLARERRSTIPRMIRLVFFGLIRV